MIRRAADRTGSSQHQAGKLDDIELISGHSAGLALKTERVVMMPTLCSLMGPQVVVMTICGAASDDKVDIILTLVQLPLCGNNSSTFSI